MKRFICEQNVAHFERLLRAATDPDLQQTLQALLADARRELSLLQAENVGADTATPSLQRRPTDDAPAIIKRQFQAEFDASPHPYMLIEPGPGLHIADINPAYSAVTFTDRTAVVGQSLFEVFPDNPDDPVADGVSNLYHSLKTAAESARPHVMAIQRYDIRAPEGAFVERHWQPINTPLHDGNGRLVFLLHHVEDVTAQVTQGDQSTIAPRDAAE
jgi:PAS domain-containing protein